MNSIETGKRLCFAMQEKGMTVKDLSERAHISIPTLKRYCNGLHTPSYFPAGKMAIALEVSAEWLRGLDVPMREVRQNDKYNEEVGLIRQVFENEQIKELLPLLMNLPSEKLIVIRSMIQDWQNENDSIKNS